MHQLKVKYHHTHQAHFVQKSSAQYLERSMWKGVFGPQAACSLDVLTDCNQLSVLCSIQQQPKHKRRVEKKNYYNSSFNGINNNSMPTQFPKWRAIKWIANIWMIFVILINLIKKLQMWNCHTYKMACRQKPDTTKQKRIYWQDVIKSLKNFAPSK